MSGYTLSQRVRHELRGIWEFIAADDIEAADRWVTTLIKQFQLLARNPHLGHERHDLTDRAVLFWPVEKYLIIYRLIGDGVRIVAVSQGSRDIPSYLRKLVNHPRALPRRYKLGCHGYNWLWYCDRHAVSRGWGDR